MKIRSFLRRYPSGLVLSVSAWIGANSFALDGPATRSRHCCNCSWINTSRRRGRTRGEQRWRSRAGEAGFASLANKTPIRDDAIFWIASMSKSLTGTALMMLVDEGKVSLDDPMEKYLPEFKGQQVERVASRCIRPRHRSPCVKS